MFVRWLEEIRRFKPSTVSRRLSVVTCFYRTCVIDAVLDASPAAYVRRPPVSSESPTLGLSHLQFEAMIVAARTSANLFDFALVAMLGLLGLRIFEACNATSTTSARSTATVSCVCWAKAPNSRWSRCHRPWAGRSTARSATAEGSDPAQPQRPPDGPPRRHPSTSPPGASAGVRMPRMHPHMLRHTYVTTMLDAGVSLRDVQIAARHADPKTTMRYDRARKNLDRHPNYILAAYMASGT